MRINNRQARDAQICVDSRFLDGHVGRDAQPAPAAWDLNLTAGGFGAAPGNREHPDDGWYGEGRPVRSIAFFGGFGVEC